MLMVNEKAYRVVAIDKDGKFVSFVTMSRLLDLLSLSLPHLPEANKSLKDLKLESFILKDVVTIHKSKIVLEAFKLMEKHVKNLLTYSTAS